MKCLCCGLEFNDKITTKEIENQWHNKCIKSFFGTENIPYIDISHELFEKIAKDNALKGFTVPGVQKKISLVLKNGSTPRLTFLNEPIGYILKPQTKEYQLLPECEYLVMQMAKIAKIKTVPFALVKLHKFDNQYAYITKRIDRININNEIYKLAMEDFCQLDNRLTVDKYKGSYERCAKIIKNYSVNPGVDISELFIRIVFSFIVGNSDMHLKNFSLIAKEPSSNNYSLSDAYDMLPVNIIMPEDLDETALTLNGKKRNITRNDFLYFASNIEIPINSAKKMIDKLLSYKDSFIKLCDESLLSLDMKENFKKLIIKRIDILTKK